MLTTVKRTPEQRFRDGRSLRDRIPHAKHAEWVPSADRRDPVSLLEEQNQDRMAGFVPVRRQRMSVSPFTFYRAGARIMASDLASTPVTGLPVQLCGDAHLANFGLFATPERQLAFGINDFDETLPGPWEWDVKRLAASFMIAGRFNGLSERESRRVTGRAVRSYRDRMADFAGMRHIEVWYTLLKGDQFVDVANEVGRGQKARKVIKKAKSKHSRQALEKLAVEIDGKYRIKSEPPLLIPQRDSLDSQMDLDVERLIEDAYADYHGSVFEDCKSLLGRYRRVDAALKVVGVGSVGTRCLILLMQGRDRNDPLFLQIKQASRSVLEEFLPTSSRSHRYANQGQRVVEGQRLMQTVSDIFLGWAHDDELNLDFYWRQLRDWKGSVDVEDVNFDDLRYLARLCGRTLARAHARTGDPIAISGYLGDGRTFDEALTEFAALYADQNERDFQTFKQEIDDGHLLAA